MALPPQRHEPTFIAWLARNPTGIPRSTALSRSLLGILLAGLLSAVVARRTHPSAPASALLRQTLGPAVVGGTVGPLAVVIVTYWLDRSLPGRDALLGYSGVMRELLHAGELSFLGALGAGLGQRVNGGARGAIVSAAGTGAIGAALYGVRGLGPGLGAGAGVLSGLVGAVLAAASAHAGVTPWGARGTRTTV